MPNDIGPGDTCVVIRSHFPANIGLLVRVLRVGVKNGERIKLPGEKPLAVVRAPAGGSVLVETLGRAIQAERLINGEARPRKTGVFSPEKLRKLGDSDGRDQTLDWKNVPRARDTPAADRVLADT